MSLVNVRVSENSSVVYAPRPPTKNIGKHQMAVTNPLDNGMKLFSIYVVFRELGRGFNRDVTAIYGTHYPPHSRKHPETLLGADYSVSLGELNEPWGKMSDDV
jgi:hypothetical protein